MLFICYANCSTCRRAQEWLDRNGLAYTFRDIREARPTEAELRTWLARSGLPLQRFFNSGGLLYRALCRLYEGKKSESDIREFLAAKTDREKAALRANSRVAEMIETIRAETGKAANVDTDAMLGELDD